MNVTASLYATMPAQKVTFSSTTLLVVQPNHRPMLINVKPLQGAFNTRHPTREDLHADLSQAAQ